MLHPDIELREIGPHLGFGVVASRPIPRGTIVWVRDPLDQTIPPARLAAWPTAVQQAMARHGYYDRDGNVVLCWDHARFVNHSCAPTSLSPGYDFDLAVRDIEPGEEITNDYAALNLACDFMCQCGAPTCRGLVNEMPPALLVPEWDALLALAFAHLPRVAQPLVDVLSPADTADLALILAGRRKPRGSAWHVRSPRPIVGHGGHAVDLTAG